MVNSSLREHLEDLPGGRLDLGLGELPGDQRPAHRAQVAIAAYAATSPAHRRR